MATSSDKPKTVRIKLKDGTEGDYTPAERPETKSNGAKVLDILHSVYKSVAGDDNEDPIVKRVNDDVNETRKRRMEQRLKESGG